MKKIAILPLVAIMLMGFSLSKDELPTDEPLRVIDNNAFRVGEYLKYRIHYGMINAGIAELAITERTTRSDRPVYHMVGKGRTVGMAEWFFRTRDTYETYMDTEAMLPWEFIRDVNEGGFIIKRHIYFDHHKNKAKDIDLPKPTTFDMASGSQDMLSAFYFARTLNTVDLKVGDEIPINMFLDHEDFPFKLKFLGTNLIKTKWGKINCLKFRPIVQSGRVFKEEEGMTLWVSDDANKIPVRLETELAIGSIKMDLIAYKNPRHPLHFQ